MSGWRDEDGRTADDRKKIRRVEDRSRLAADLRYRPLTLLKSFAGLMLILILVFAVVTALR